MTPESRAAHSSYLVASRGKSADHGLVCLDLGTGQPALHVLAGADQLSSLARHPIHQIIYATAGMMTPGRVLAWQLIDGSAEKIFDEDAGGGELEPCHIAIEPGSRFVAVANYTSGQIVLWPLAEDGRPEGLPTRIQLSGSGADSVRQDAAHPHQVHFSSHPRGVTMYATDLGADLVRVFDVRFDGRRIAAVEQTAAHSLPAGTGPRHLVFLRDGRVAISGELASTFITGRLDSGTWHVLRSTLKEGTVTGRTNRNYPGDLALSPAGNYVYLANRGYDTVSTFDVRGEEPVLVSEISAGVAWPQHFLVESDALLVAGWDSSAIARYPLVDGMPGSPSFTPVPSPGWLLRS